MLFPTTDFAIFFGVVFVCNWLLAPFAVRWKLFAILASYVFYAWYDWRFIFLLAASTIVSAVAGRLIHASRSPRVRRRVLVLALAADLGLLGFFKYADFFAASVDNALHHLGVGGTPVGLLDVTVPVAISFFTFMAMSYVIDIYRHDLEPAPFVDVAVYLSFFPHLLSGPIVRGSELLPQIARSRQRDPRAIDLPTATFLIFGGLFKKVVISSYVSTAIVQPVFDAPSVHSAPEILLAAYGYAVQIYCDFSGYTDIAIGCALLLGFQFPQNFDVPYTARSMQEFWRRWHMTLSFWLRDYLYIPLGGSRGSRRMLYRNLMITMVLGGLWHGAAWTFVIWGAIHGVAQCTGHWHRQRRIARGLTPQSERPIAVWLQRLATFHVVCIGWIFFDSATVNGAFTMISRLVTAWSGPDPLVRLPVVAAIVGSLALQFVPNGWSARAREVFGRMSAVAQGAAVGATLLVITTLGPPGVAPFIYYKF
ncbi:MAG TPA: MBOAT family O-acyltransferase [Acidimicrobiales bacterium]|nr:MBOAT family O-acyltransferase [Acidimicrobiales bacterium]